MRGSELAGTRYQPPYPNVSGAHIVVSADLVATDEGTGLVHMATAFGAEDMEVGRRHGWPMFKPVDDEGKFTSLAPEFVRGLFVKAADPLIIDDLRARGLLFRAEEIEHTYPLCWRCDTPLIYYARPAWYVRTPIPLVGATCVVPAAVPSDLKSAALPALALEAGWAMKKRVLPMVPSQTGSEPIGDPANARFDKATSGTDRRNRAIADTSLRRNGSFTRSLPPGTWFCGCAYRLRRRADKYRFGRCMNS